ncbi:MAG: putative metal-binding motif-containing protein, partial [Flavobacteriaceae bacterium]|nr:putative metal-binding motif-containing protein [Flavobacteriaceae bacterium]
MILKNVKKAIVPYCLILLAIIAFTVVSCESEELSPQETQGIKDGLDERKKDRIQICHYDEDLDRYFIIEVNANAWPDHDLHGDVRLDDQDGDGYVPYNECEFGEMGDCDDLDAGINPGEEDILCNGIDENCDGVDAEYPLQAWYYFENNDGDDWYVYFPENNFFGTCPPTENHYPF